jgi:hypothetical protein
MLVPLIVAFAPRVSGEINGPIIWVNPVEVKKWAPCIVSSTFDVEVKLWNKEDLTGVGVYAFDFTVYWLNSTVGFDHCGSQKNSFITLVTATFTAPWEHFFVVAAETVKKTDGGLFYNGYHLAITALDNSLPLSDAQVSLLKLTFHIDREPNYPDVWTTPFILTDVLLSDLPDPHGVVVPLVIHEVDDGAFVLASGQPDVHLNQPVFCEYKAGMAHTVEIWFSNMSKVYGFGFAISYPTKLFKADIQHIIFCDMFPPPYEYEYMKVDTVGEVSTLTVEIRRPCEKPSVSCQAGPVATVNLVSQDLGLDDYLIPEKGNFTISLCWAYLKSKACSSWTPTYSFQTAGDFPLLAYDTTIDYFWRPRTGDLNLDGAVDIQDLSALAEMYGEDLGVGGWGALDGTNTVVDIFDFVVVAKYFGKPYICDISDP